MVASRRKHRQNKNNKAIIEKLSPEKELQQRQQRYYMRYLHRAKLPTLYSHYAPWFHRVDEEKLGKYTSSLYKRMEHSYYYGKIPMEDDEKRHKVYLKYLEEMKEKNVMMKDQIQLLVRKAFSFSSFNIEELTIDEQQEKSNNLVHEEEENIDSKPKMNAPPGLAAPVQTILQSHGNHEYFHYAGKWKNGIMDSLRGKYVYADSGVYEGGWKDNYPSGNGIARYPSVIVKAYKDKIEKTDLKGAYGKYTGQWKNGKYHGKGVLLYSMGLQYEGEWYEGKQHGRGKLSYQEGNKDVVYEGDYFMGKRHGTGKAYSRLGYYYIGVWQHNRIDGKGKIMCPNGSVYQRDDWGPCVLGEAIVQTIDYFDNKEIQQKVERQKLYHVLNDLRTLDLIQSYHERVEKEAKEKKEKMKYDLKKQYKETREDQEVALEGFINQDTDDEAEEEKYSGEGGVESAEQPIAKHEEQNVEEGDDKEDYDKEQNV